MADENQLPEDDGSLKVWSWTTPKHPRYQRIAEVPLRREEAIRRLRDRPPAELGDETHIVLGSEEPIAIYPEPIKPHGTVRARYTEQEQTDRMLASALGGFTVHMPGKAP